ncbi:MAG TPA: hypothetical protein P5056_01885 [Candidatus Paceibacterota bacterium]|nr:hypothetical protein [Candidatus Paceibacterota bacterium]
MFYLTNDQSLPNANVTTLTSATPKKKAPVVDVLGAAVKNERPITDGTEGYYLGEVLAVLFDYAPLSPRGNDGVQNLITFLCRHKCPDLRLGDLETINRLKFHAKTRLEIQFPALTKLKDEFEKMKEDSRKLKSPDNFMKSWVKKQTKIYGTTYFVRTVIK